MNKIPRNNKAQADSKLKKSLPDDIMHADKIIGPAYKFANAKAKSDFLSKVSKARGNTVYEVAKTKKQSKSKD